ncbi:hypothetical protein C1645_748269 [Glomus cerebriforme]|uniref:Uncharacterized protein n=1 Tax=Glomus cerebriforme TaxID=658196 RepID=A0A397TM04_9GLOM|nr:hypothetical protein C1645_748269 [Glomus cerebriforme]
MNCLVRYCWNEMIENSSLFFSHEFQIYLLIRCSCKVSMTLNFFYVSSLNDLFVEETYLTSFIIHY